MSDPKVLMDELVAALDGTVLHKWDLVASAARGGLIAYSGNERFAIQLEVWRIESAPSGRPDAER